MKKKLIAMGLIVTSLMTNISYASNILMRNNQGEKDISLMVAHAGGAINGFRYTNSLEALNNSYQKGFRYMEMDFNMTSDNIPVAIHDWEAMVKRLFNREPGVMTHEEFKTGKTFNDLSLMDVADVAHWLSQRPDPFVITDIKDQNYEILKYISDNHYAVKTRFIPQIYSIEEYQAVKDLGYDKIILTLYKSENTREEILDFAKNNKLFGLAMNYNNAYDDFPAQLKELGVRVYVHTVNDLDIYENLYPKGVVGIYTDYFEPSKFPYMR